MLEQSDIEILKECMNEGPDEALYIFPTNSEIQMYNNEMILKTCEDPKLLEAEDFEKDKVSGRLTKRKVNFSKAEICLPTSILLAEGARVMLIKNAAVDDGLVNGVIGTVISILKCSKGSLPEHVFIHFDNEKVGKKAKIQKIISGKRYVGLEPSTEDVPFRNGIRRQYPLQLAWACTVHKVQGLTVSEAVVDLNRCFAYGQAYVALSRVTSKSGLHILPIEDSKLNKQIFCDSDIIHGIKTMKNFSMQKSVVKTDESLITVIYHSIQGLENHHEDLKANRDLKNPFYICMTETWLDSKSDIVDLPNYELHHLPRSAAYSSNSPFYTTLKNMKHGGVGVFVKTGVGYDEVNIGNINLECFIFRIPEIDCIILTVYRTQKYYIEKFLENLSLVLSRISLLSSSVVVLGDFNQDILKGEKSVINFMKSKGFQQYVKEETTGDGTLIDHVYIENCSGVEVCVIPTYYSYPDAILLNFESKK